MQDFNLMEEIYMGLGLKYRNQEQIFTEREGDTPYLEYSMLEKTGIVRHGFSTRLGGVSKGCWSSLNLSFTRGDKEEDVRENFNRIGNAIGVRPENMVFAHQTHTANVKIVTEEERGMGITRPRNYQDVDGLVTNVKDLCLVTFFADCVPLFFVDPINKVIGLAHSGWRGTVGKIGKETIRTMQENFGCNPENILAAVGPSICQECYEVSEDVIEKFRENFLPKYYDELFYKKANGRYQLDLWKANEVIFLECGIKKEHIAITNVCTHCNSELMFSHRATGDKRGNLCAFLALK